MAFDIKRMIQFEHNVGTKEKKIRMVAGIAALAITLFIASIPLLILGIALIATAYTGWCPAYSAFDKNSLEPWEKGESEGEAEASAGEKDQNPDEAKQG